MIENGISSDSGTPHSLLDVRATTPQYLAAGVEDVLLNNSPLAAVRRFAERTAARGDALPTGWEGVPGTDQMLPHPVPMISGEEATKKYSELGLKFDAPVASAEADLIADTKRRELAANSVFRAARADAGGGAGLGAGRSLLSVATDFFGSAADPINFASVFLPIVGPGGRALLTSRLGAAGGAIAAGALEGAGGQAIVEPILAASAIGEQRDYEWWNSVSNIVLGGVLGGGIHGVTHFFGVDRAGGGEPPARPPGGPAGPLPPSPGGPAALRFGDYAGGWRAALEQVGQRGDRQELATWSKLPAFDREAPMVRALDAVSPETRRAAGTLATMQYVNGRSIDVGPVLQMDPGWRAPMSDPLERMRALVDQRRIAGLLPAPSSTIGAAAEALAARTAEASRYQDFAPGNLLVDAKRFQFKAGGDVAGVTDRLAGVTTWDQRLAGVSIVWQDKAGKFYVVDGHQRHGLANRLAAGGQDAQLHAIVLRESRGESEGFARALAAYKNVAEGTGTAIDAAKILRETSRDKLLRADLDAGRLPPLPPSSALVRDASSLAALPDEAFGVVAAGKVPPNQAAHVARILTDPKQQEAAIAMLARLQPDTSEQARLIVEQIRSAGFKEGETSDLFGRRDVAESLMLERARVLEAAARNLRKDASVFRTLVDREHVAAEAGNVLARDANVERLGDDKAALAVLEALGNRAGPVATALNEAARGLADGGKIRGVVDDFLKAVRAESAAYRPAARATGELGDTMDSLFKAADETRQGSATSDTIGDRAALERQTRELERTPADQVASPLKLAEAEHELLQAEAKQAIEAHPELKADLEAADVAAKDAELFGKAADALAGCKNTGGQ